jgi:hypothetical protein
MSELFALDVLIRVLVEDGRVADAEAAMARANELWKQVGGTGIISIVGSDALVKAARGEVAAALAEVRAAIVDADRSGSVDSALDLREVLAELLVAHGPRDEARRAVEALRKQAGAYGYMLAVRDSGALARKLR